MLPEWGHLALIATFMLCVFQCFLPFVARYHENLALRWAKDSARASTTFLTASFFILMACFLKDDWSVRYVAENSHQQLPWFYKACALWGAHEGSLFLWAYLFLLLSFFAWVKARKTLSPSFCLKQIALSSAISVGFLGLILWTSNPFLRVLEHLPQQGMDLNPLLQDPGFVSHPPILYTGYVGFGVVFCFAMAALWEGKLERAALFFLRKLSLLAWAFLTLGIVLGSWWSYRQLGWGGWWFWDPVENASLMPWFLGTALIHSLRMATLREGFRAWTVLLAIFTFALCLLGTFLVRSGVLISVHAFAVDAKRGLWILCFLGIVLGASLFLYAARARTLLHAVRLHFFSKEMAFLGNNILLVTMALSVLLGTLYPLVLQVLSHTKISVGPPYFNAIVTPLFVLLLALMIFTPFLRWGALRLSKKAQGYGLIFLAFILFSIFVSFLSEGVLLCLVFLIWSVMLCVSAFLHLIRRAQKWRAQLGFLLGHVGMAVTLLGIAVVSYAGHEKTAVLSVGDSFSIAGHTLSWTDLSKKDAGNYKGVQARFEEGDTRLMPERRYYPAREMATSKVDIDVTPFRDIYLALGAPIDDTHWQVRAYVKPFVRWIWVGGLMMAMGAILTVLLKRREAR